MYNRYIPTDDGTYHRTRVDSGEPITEPSPVVPAPPPAQPAKPEQRLDTDELLLLVILLLLLMDDQDEDLIVLIAALAFLIL